jgi:N-acetylmuramoyl-L-alanine amidase
MKRKYLVIHCTASPEGREVDKETLIAMHTNPCENSDGSFNYLGKKYPNEESLPKAVRTLRGRGWSKAGYQYLIHLDGSISNLLSEEDNGDDILDSWEISNGIWGKDNGLSSHIVYAGGMDKQYKNVKDTRTPAQLETMEAMIKQRIMENPNILIGGHGQFGVYDNGVLNRTKNNKGCPSFSVPMYLREIEVDEDNIYTADPFGYVRFYETGKWGK